MKTDLKLVLGLFFAFTFFNCWGQATEEYAIINAYQKGKKNFISVTIGSQSTDEKEYEKEKNDKPFDMAPIIAVMEDLNKRGYTLVNGSTSMIPMGQVGGALPFYSFIFKKSKQ